MVFVEEHEEHVEKCGKTGNIIAKTCTVCGEYKPLADFTKHKGMALGYQSKCKSCNKKARAAQLAPPTPEAIALKAINDR